MSCSALPSGRHATLPDERLPAALPAAAPAAAPITVPFVPPPSTRPSTAPAIAPPMTFVRSFPPDTCTVSIWPRVATSPSPVRDSPFTSIARTWKWMRLASGGSARSTDVTSSTTVEPAGITAPLLPVTVDETVAVNLSPASAEVHARPFVVIPTRVPAPMTPAVPVAGAGVVAGTTGSGSASRGSGVLGRGVVATLTGGDSRRGAAAGRDVRAGARSGTGAGVSAGVADAPSGASLNTIVGAASLWASARSRAKAESVVAGDSVPARSRHAPRSASAESVGRTRGRRRMEVWCGTQRPTPLWRRRA